jgi:hypothetical protein
MTEESQPPGTTRFSRLFQSIPGLQVLRSYQGKNLSHDVLAGLVICLVLIPSALAYAGMALSQGGFSSVGPNLFGQ